jgi:signal transduction histidine kinase
LSIVHQLVELHHGKIEVKSKVGQGTSFIIIFPVAESTKLVELFSGKK